MCDMSCNRNKKVSLKYIKDKLQWKRQCVQYISLVNNHKAKESIKSNIANVYEKEMTIQSTSWHVVKQTYFNKLVGARTLQGGDIKTITYYPDVVLCHVLPSEVMSCFWCHFLWCLVMPSSVLWCNMMIWVLMLCHVRSCESKSVMSCYVMSCDAIFYNLIS